jgi:hypothetical protein
MRFCDLMPVILERLFEPIFTGQERSERVRTDQSDMLTAVDS